MSRLVPVALLRPLVEAWLERHLGGAVRRGRKDENGLEAIADAAGVPVRKLYDIRHGLRRSVEFGTADKLLIAMGRPDVWHTDAELYEIFAKGEQP